MIRIENNLKKRQEQLQRNPGLILEAEKRIISIILETKKAFFSKNKNKFRDGPNVFNTDVKAPNFEFPAKKQLSYDNPIVGFVHIPNDATLFNVIMKDG